jgi:hypothetical protein
MTYGVTVNYLSTQEDVYDVLQWLMLNIGNPMRFGAEPNEYYGPNWKLYHTSTVSTPTYVVTACEFDKSEDAALFALRWS